MTRSFIQSVRAWFLRAGAIVCDPKRPEREFADELDSHVALHIDENLRAGLTPDAARRAALVTLGGVEVTKERHRERRTIRFIETCLQDLRYAMRTVRRSPGFALAAISSLALGIGATTAAFSAVHGLLLSPYPYQGADRMVVMSQSMKSGPVNPTLVTSEDLRSLLQAGSLDGGMMWDDFPMSTKHDSLPESLRVGKLSPNAFQFLGVPPQVGRTFTADFPGANSESEQQAVLGYRYWQSHYSGSPDAVGRVLQLDQQNYTIVGVMPDRFRFLDS